MTAEEEKALLETVTKLQSRVNGQEELVQKFKTEIGEQRAVNARLEESLKKVVDTSATKVDTTTVSKDASHNQGGSQGGSAVTQVSDIGKLMTKEQKAKADDIFKKLKPEDRILIKSDPEKRNLFFKAAIEAVPSIPESLFDDESAKNEEDIHGFKNLFGLGNKEKNFVPGSRNVSANGFAGAASTKPEEPSAKRLLGGRIPRPMPVTQTKE